MFENFTSKRTWALVPMFFLAAIVLPTQVNTGAIVGRITDPTGAILTNAEVHLRHWR